VINQQSAVSDKIWCTKWKGRLCYNNGVVIIGRALNSVIQQYQMDMKKQTYFDCCLRLPLTTFCLVIIKLIIAKVTILVNESISCIKKIIALTSVTISHSKEEGGLWHQSSMSGDCLNTDTINLWRNGW